MSRRTPEQQRAIDLMAGWGWGDLVASRDGHTVRLRRNPGWKWCASSIVWYAEDKDARTAGACREHLHESWAPNA